MGEDIEKLSAFDGMLVKLDVTGSSILSDLAIISAYPALKMHICVAVW